MARRRQDDQDDLTTADDTTAGASFGNVRPSAPLAKPADLQTALASPAEDALGTKIYENVGLSDFTPASVTRVGDLLGLRSYFMSQLGPRYLWIIKLSLIEWPTLSAQEKQLHAAMRNLLSPLTLLVPKPFSSTGFGKRSKTPPNLSAPS